MTVGGNLVGFILINSHSYLPETVVDHTVAEFFILRKWRRKGIGRQVMREIFCRYPGRWEVGQERANVKAQAFWRLVVAEATAGNYIEVDSHEPNWDGPVQSFTLT